MKRKSLSMISIGIVTFVMGYLFILGWLAGIAAAKLGAGKSEGHHGRLNSIIIPLGKRELHLHHWLYSLGLMGISSVYGFYLFNPQITYGLLGGLAFQGIYCYNDWHRIIIRREQI